MTTIVSGRVVETETGAALDDMRVIALGDWLLTTEKLGEAKTENGGQFRLEIDGVNGTPLVPSSFRVRVVDVVGRPLTADIDVPGTVATHEMGDVKVAAADKDGLQVTNLTGTAQFVSDGNAVRLLVDGAEAFGRIAEDMQGAKQSVNMVQLFFALPEYDTFPAKEDPALVFKFLPPDLVPIEPNDPSHPDPPDRNDLRPERLLIDVAHADGTIRILLNEPALGWPEGVFWLAVLTPLALGLGLGGVAGIAALAGVGIAFFPILLATTLIAYFVEAVLIILDAGGHLRRREGDGLLRGGDRGRFGRRRHHGAGAAPGAATERGAALQDGDHRRASGPSSSGRPSHSATSTRSTTASTTRTAAPTRATWCTT